MLVRRILSLAVLAACLLSHTFTEAADSATSSSKTKTEFIIPAFENVFAQQFSLSVMTQSHGTFNATLRLRSSMTFPERIRGEIVPRGMPVLRSGQKPLPHFSRSRTAEDERLCDVPHLYDATKEEFVMGEEERPTLFVVDVHLQQSNAPLGQASLYYLPAESKALQEAREAITDGVAEPVAVVNVAFRIERGFMTGNPFSDVPPLARVSSSTLLMPSAASRPASPATDVEEGEEAAEQQNEEDAAAAERPMTSQGSVIFRWVNEHQFTVDAFLDKEDGKTEEVWIYAYTAPTTSVFDRKDRQTPARNQYFMIVMGLVGFAVQVFTGFVDGKKRAADKAQLRDGAKSQDKAIKKKKD